VIDEVGLGEFSKLAHARLDESELFRHQIGIGHARANLL